MVIAGVILGLLLFAVRIPAVKLATRGAGFTKQQQGIVTVSLPRGMAAGVLATIPSASGVEGTENLPPLVFSAVVTTIVIFAVGFPIMSKVKVAPEKYLPTPSDNDPLEVTIAAKNGANKADKPAPEGTNNEPAGDEPDTHGGNENEIPEPEDSAQEGDE
jgi:NhaP-type Na+/H+ or K+/H+ antiporter